MTQKLYTEMSAEEQAAWVADFAQVMEQHGERLALLAKGKETATADDAGVVRQVFGLLAAWPFAQDFCEKAQRYGDYMARTSRLPVYIEKVKERLADGLTMTDQDGNVVAYVNPSTPMRRRGRPTKEEVAASLRGETLTDNGQVADDVEARKRRTIAAMLGLQVVVHGDAPREKNNAELKAERDAKKAEYEKQNPSLFGQDNTPARVAQGVSVTSAPGAAAQEVTNPAKAVEGHGDDRSSVAAEAVSPCAQLMSDSYEMRMAQDKLHLNQLAWLLSPELAKRTETVQSLRVTAEAASERAKTLADIGQPATVIEPYSQQAKEATEAYLAIYAAVDEELAILHKRLYLDEPFKERFIKKHSTASQKVNIESILHVTRPYYEKMKSPELDLRIRTIIEQENPEYAAKMKAEEERKQEVSDLLRYLKRKDKPNVKQRIETMEKRYARLIELLGEDEAKVYRPIVDAAIADYEANFKAASKREKSDAGIDSSEREQARRENGKAADEAKAAKKAPTEPAPTEKKATKQESKKRANKQTKKGGK